MERRIRGALESGTERCGGLCGQSLWIDHENLFGMNDTVYTVSFGSPPFFFGARFARHRQLGSQSCTQKSYDMLLISLSVVRQQILVLRSLDDP